MTARNDVPALFSRRSHPILQLLLPLTAGALAGACAVPVQGPGQPSSGIAYVLDGAELVPGQPLASALAARVPGLRSYETPYGCPALTLRTARIAGPEAAPTVYVDGTRTYGTCALRDLDARDVARVEVYPQGLAARPGYASSATGLILIFLKKG